MAHTALVEDSYETRKLKKCSVSKINRLHPKQIDFSSNETEPLVCALCGDVCANLEVFKMHVCKQLPRNMLKCTDCGVLLINKKEFEGHIYSHFCAKTEQCFEELHALVNKNNKVNYPRSTDLALRLLNHEEDDCSKTFKIETDVQFLKFPCGNCGSIFVDKAGGSENENAIRDMLNDESQKPRYCEKCNSKQQYNELQKNKTENATKKKDTRPYKYADCGDGFKRPYHLKRHESVHRPIIKQHKFKCSRCCMFFNTKLLLMDHRKATHPSCEDTDGNQTNEDTFLPTEGVENNSEPYHGTGKEYKCQDCDAIFRRMSVLKHHQRVHQEPYKCKECEDTFSTESDLQQHDCPEHDSHHCDDCGMSFSNGQLLCSHRCRHTDKDEDQSSNADHSPKTENATKKKDTRPYKCADCGDGFKRPYHLKRHESVHRPIIKQHKFKCSRCCMFFNTKLLLMDHRKATHPSCEDTDGNQTNEDTFLPTEGVEYNSEPNHGTGKEYKCQDCDAIFRRMSVLKHHQRVHQEPYKCKECEDTFSTKSDLQQHDCPEHDSHHCDDCGMSFSNGQLLGNHHCRHTDKDEDQSSNADHSPKTENATKKKDTRPYKCADCGDGFKRPYHLKRHESVHRPIIKQHNFKCSRCCMFFNTKLLLMDHRKATHPSCEDTDGNQTNEDTFLPTEDVENNSEPYRGTGKEYKCQDCDSIFRRMSVLKHHQRVHQEPYKCKECEDTFSTESDLQQHDCPEHDSHHCDDCGMSFSNGQLLCSHRCRHTNKDEDQSSIADHSPKPLIENTSKNPLLAQLLKRTNHCIERSFSCKECGKTFKRQCDLCDHVALHSGEKPFKCDICNAKYATARKLKKHLISHSTRYACKECGKGFSSQYRLRQHMATHSSEKPFICDLCGLGYATVKNLTQHRTRHTKPFVCTKCGKGYACSAYLRIHSNFHTGEMPFSCSFCSAKFRSPSNLRCHESIHSTDKPYKCKICNKAFTTRVRYKDHQVVHAENTYLCETCGSAFASRKRLLNHQIAHIGKKPYACDECGKTFARKLTVGIHMRIHTGERPFKCTICAATFIQQSHLNKHLRTMHETVLYETESI